MSVLWCRYLQCLYFFPRGVSRGEGDEVEAEIAQPGDAELSDQRAQAARLWAAGNCGSGYVGLGNLPGFLSKSCPAAKMVIPESFLGPVFARPTPYQLNCPVSALSGG